MGTAGRSNNGQATHDPSRGDLHTDLFSAPAERVNYYRFTPFEQRLHILQRLVQGQDFLILVIGKAGSGKTVLLNRFLESTDDNWRTCRIRTRLAASPPQGPALTNLDQLPAYILEENQIPIVMFDDAHRLDPIELKYLLQDALTPGSRRKLKRLVLFCEPQFMTTMEKLSKAISSETAINKIFMPAISRAETAAYLWHRLSTAGYRGKNPFNSEAVKKIHRASGGLPGRINKEAGKYLQSIRSPQKSFFRFLAIPESKAKRFWIWVGAGLVAVALVIWITRPDPAGTLTRPDRPEMAGVVKKTIETASSGQMAAGRPAKPKQKIKSGPQTAPPAVINQKSEPIAALKPTESPPKVAIIYEKKPKTPTERKTPQQQIYREKWLLGQNPSFYTIQIMGGRNEKALQNYVRSNRHRYQGPLAYYQTIYKGDIWYPLLYGIYPTRKQALAAQRALPQDIQKLSPWIRKLSTVQKAVREGKK